MMAVLDAPDPAVRTVMVPGILPVVRAMVAMVRPIVVSGPISSIANRYAETIGEGRGRGRGKTSKPDDAGGNELFHSLLLRIGRWIGGFREGRPRKMNEG